MVLEIHMIGSIKAYTSFQEKCPLQCSFLFESGDYSNANSNVNDDDNDNSGMQGERGESTAASGKLDTWYAADGAVRGMTQLDTRSTGSGVWDHPIDIHYATSGTVGWPRLKLQVWGREIDSKGEGLRPVFCGYGFCHCPPPGRGNEIDVVIWRPRGKNLRERLVGFFFGERPRLGDENTYWECTDSERYQCGASTCTIGIVKISLDVIVAKR